MKIPITFRNCIRFAAVLCTALSCNIKPAQNRDVSHVTRHRTIVLHLNPAPGSILRYDINNESEMKMELNGTEVNNVNQSTFGVDYTIGKDSLGNFLFQVKYDKIHIHTKNGEAESDMDADNSAFSMNPAERMLGALKEARIRAVISPLGEVKSVSGYKELTEKILTSLNSADANTRNMGRQQWEQMFGEEAMKASLGQLFRIFPDSAIQVGDKWTMDSKQRAQFNLNLKSVYTLKDIEDNLATIECAGKITSDSAVSNIMGNSVTAILQGEQKGVYQIDSRTGMLIKSRMENEFKGTIEMMGRIIPITFDNTITVSRQ